MVRRVGKEFEGFAAGVELYKTLEDRGARRAWDHRRDERSGALGVFVERVVAEDGEIRALVAGIAPVAVVAGRLRHGAASVAGRMADHGFRETEESTLIDATKFR